MSSLPSLNSCPIGFKFSIVSKNQQKTLSVSEQWGGSPKLHPDLLFPIEVTLNHNTQISAILAFLQPWRPPNDPNAKLQQLVTAAVNSQQEQGLWATWKDLGIFTWKFNIFFYPNNL